MNVGEFTIIFLFPQSVVTCMDTLKKSSNDEGAISCLVVGSESKEVFILDPEAFTVLSRVSSFIRTSVAYPLISSTSLLNGTVISQEMFHSTGGMLLWWCCLEGFRFPITDKTQTQIIFCSASKLKFCFGYFFRPETLLSQQPIKLQKEVEKSEFLLIRRSKCNTIYTEIHSTALPFLQLLRI